MKKNIVLYCKSYSGDIDKIKKLSLSIENYNKDKIPFYISVPTKDLQLFKKEIKNSNIISDDDIYKCKGTNGWFNQQIIKSNFWKLGLCNNYLCLDSDSYFIKDFFVNDFIAYDTVPYTVCHEQKELFQFTNKNISSDIYKNFIKEKEFFFNLFKLKFKRAFDFGPSPIIFSCKVWELLDKHIIIHNNLSFEDLIIMNPSEFSWYGYSLLYFNPFQLIPIQPLFKVFHYFEQYKQEKTAGYTEDIYSKNYLGIILQSNFETSVLDF